MKKLYRLTQSGVNELQDELDGLVGQRGVLADRIRQARELGDLSENAEYQSAREEQDRLEARISELEHILQNMQLIKKPKIDGHVRLGSTVRLTGGGEAKEFQLVGTMEADPLNGKISDESPIGKALLGKQVGDKAEIKLNGSHSSYKIVEIA
ncbi:transcription elongation factor GreA [Candidatus Saccharibacteria bacterium]|nr:transcription elongation factor GreA [Candidatus Saccharibacteria bacterium]